MLQLDHFLSFSRYSISANADSGFDSVDPAYMMQFNPLFQTRTYYLHLASDSSMRIANATVLLLVLQAWVKTITSHESYALSSVIIC